MYVILLPFSEEGNVHWEL